MEESHPPFTTSNRFLFVLVFSILIAAGVLVYLYTRYSALSENSTAVNQVRVAEAVVNVSKLIDVPQDETPTLAIVDDMSMLEGQAFFANAVVGDQVLLYANSRKVYLYRPSKDIIVEVATLNIGE